MEDWEIQFDRIIGPDLKGFISLAARKEGIAEYKRGLEDGKKIGEIIKKNKKKKNKSNSPLLTGKQ